MEDTYSNKEHIKHQEIKYYYVNKNNLKKWNMSLGLIHIISSVIVIGLFFLYKDKIKHSVVTTDFYYNNLTINYNLMIVLIPFPLLTGLFHLYIGSVGYKYYCSNVLYKGVNPFRWIEYSITSTIMIWIIWTLSGGTNLIQGSLLSVLNVMMIITGFISEYINGTNIEDDNNYIIKGNTKRTPIDIGMLIEFLYFTDKPKKTNWTFIVLGFILFIMIWTVLLSYFLVNVVNNYKNVPWFVYVIDIGLLIMFLLFGLLMMLHYKTKDILISDINSNDTFEEYKNSHHITIFFSNRYNNEICYQLLSLSSKLFLTWILWGGIIQSF